MTRFDYFGIGYLIFATVVVFIGASQLKSNAEDVLQWLPDQSQARDDYDHFESCFGGDDFVVLTWPGCTIEDPRLIGLTDYLRKNDSQNLIQSVSHGGEMIDRLSQAAGLSRRTIIQRFRGVYFGLEDPTLTTLVVELSVQGTANRRESMDLVWSAVAQQPNLDKNEVSIGGYPFIGTFIDKQLIGSYGKLLVPSVVLATLVAMFCLRNVALTLIVFVTAFSAGAMSVSFIPLCGFKFSGLMSIIPALVFVLGISGSIHLIRYSLDCIGHPAELLKIGWKPCVISSITTAIGMLSLLRSDFPAIRHFGLFCASGVGFSLISQLVLVPWLLHRFGQAGSKSLAMQKSKSGFWAFLLAQIRKLKWLILASTVLLFAGGGTGLTKISAEVEVEKLFSPDSEIIQNLKQLESRLGPVDQTELLVEFSDASPEGFPDRVRLIRKIQNQVRGIDQVQVVFSLANGLPSEPARGNVRSLIRRATYRTQLRKKREMLTQSNLIAIQGNIETWRLSVRFPFTEEFDFQSVKQKVLEKANAEIERFETEDSKPLKVRLIYTGKTHLFLHAQTTLLTDLFFNFLLAFLIITPILIIVLRSWTIGLLAMIPNIFPTLFVFGGLGWANYPIDLSLAMTASVALGIAVDDTTHFLIRFREYGGHLGKTYQPMLSTIMQCGPAMLHTTMIGGAGLIAYYFSQMLVVSKFSWAITTLLMIALVADVIMLPALLLIIGNDPISDGDVTTAGQPVSNGSS
ncbi:MAG: MMPL family transporter [Planctomycetota bacterium]